MNTEMAAPPLNEELIYKVVKHIKADLRRLEMGKWGHKYGNEDFLPAHYPPCRTQACFAGWAAILTTPENVLFPFGPGSLLDVEETAAEKLGLDKAEAATLFYSGMYISDKEEQYAAVVKSLKIIFNNRGLEFKEPE